MLVSAYEPWLNTLQTMSRYLDLASGPIYHEDYGGSGRPLVLVHGLGGSIANWDMIGPALARHGHVVAIDLPGFGLSPPRTDWSLDTHVDAIFDVIEHLGGPALVTGNSLGALLGEIAASKRPDLVDALILLSPATPPRLPDPRIDWNMARRLLLASTPVVGPALSKRVMESMTPRELVNDSLRRITNNPARVPMDMVESFVEVARKRSHYPWTVDAIPKTGQSIRELFLRRSRFVSMIRDIVAPTLVVQGMHDHIVSPTSVEWLCSLRPDWELIQMDDTGHTPQIDAPVRTLEIIDQWLVKRATAA